MEENLHTIPHFHMKQGVYRRPTPPSFAVISAVAEKIMLLAIYYHTISM